MVIIFQFYKSVKLRSRLCIVLVIIVFTVTLDNNISIIVNNVIIILLNAFICVAPILNRASQTT